MDEDWEAMTREPLASEVPRLRAGIRRLGWRAYRKEVPSLLRTLLAVEN